MARRRTITTGFQRVGTEPLRPLPLVTGVDDRCRAFRRAYNYRLDNIVYTILRQAQFVTSNHPADARDEEDPAKTRWGIVSRRGIEDSTSYITVLITVPWDPDTGTSTWDDVCLQLQLEIDSDLQDTSYSVLVEMVSPQVAGPLCCTPVFGREDLSRDWESIKDGARRILESDKSTASTWSCIALFCLGLDESGKDNPPTLYVSVARASPEQGWQCVVGDLERYLKSCGHGLRLHIEHSAPQLLSRFGKEQEVQVLGSDPLLALEPYENKVSMGADLSGSLHLAQTSVQVPKKGGIVGTMGCYIEIADQHGIWKRFALTSYHVVRSVIPGFKIRSGADDALLPEEGTALRHADIHGFKPGHGFKIPLESPSRGKHNRTISYYTQVAAQQEDIRELAERRIRESVEFFDAGKHILGHLYAGSGFAYRTVDNGLLDWALIEVLPARLGTNNLPSKRIWPPGLSDCLPPATISGQPLRGPAPAHQLFPEKHVYQVSAITKAMTGAFSEHRADVRLTNWGYLDADICQKTSELVFFHRGREVALGLANRGDSGAVLFDDKARAVGLRGPMGGGMRSYAHVTPLEHVLSHIADFLGVKASAVRVAQL